MVLPVRTLEEISPPVDFGWFDVDVLLKVMQPATWLPAPRPHTRSIRTLLHLLLLLQRHTGLDAGRPPPRTIGES